MADEWHMRRLDLPYENTTPVHWAGVFSCLTLFPVVGGTGIEPVTPRV